MELRQPGALISVYYKEGIDRLARTLHAKGYDIYSTGGTAGHLKELGVPFIQVSDFTASPEMLGGRVKTLHPKVFGSILGRKNLEKDTQSMEEHGMVSMDVVVVNLYPFQEEVAKGNETTHQKIIEQIDVGGPSMLRAAAKNHERVSAICDPRDYNILAAMLEAGEEIPLAQREEWAQKVFALTSAYDAAINDYFATCKLAREATRV